MAVLYSCERKEEKEITSDVIVEVSEPKVKKSLVDYSQNRELLEILCLVPDSSMAS